MRPPITTPLHSAYSRTAVARLRSGLCLFGFLALGLALVLGLGASCKGPDDELMKMGADDPKKTSPFPGLADCQGTSLTMDGVLDVDVRTVRISGSVTLNGSELPSSASSRGSIQFLEKRTGTSVSVSLGSFGAPRYEALLAPAEYDIRYIANPELCKSAANTLPCIGGVIKKGFRLTSSGVLDLDLTTVTVQGTITVNGGMTPTGNDADLASISFRRKDDFTLSTSQLGTFLHAYRVVLLTGSYDIFYAAPFARCARTSSVPCVSGRLKTGIEFSTSGVFDLDIPTVKVSGRVTLNGQPIVGGDVDLGAIAFRRQAGADGLTYAPAVDTTSLSPASRLEPYQLTLLPGAYDVVFAPQSPTCQSAVPCITGTLRKDVSLLQSGTLDLDLQSVQIQGKVTVAGQPVELASEPAGLIFRSAEGTEVDTGSFGAKKLSSYRLSLFPGTYQIKFRPVTGGCTILAATTPCNRGLLKAEVALQVSGVLDLDVPVIKVSGRITVNGGEVPGAARGMAKVSFLMKNEVGGSETAASSADLSSYALRLLPGTYEVRYVPLRTASCSTAATIPCNAGPIKEALDLQSSGLLDLDIPMVRIGGNVQLDGLPLPTTTESRGQLLFYQGSDAVFTPSLGSSGPASYNLALLKGPYVVAHVPLASSCAPDGFGGPDMKSRKIPCTGQVLLGCQ